MTSHHEPGRIRLQAIARRAMLERGLVPDFSDAALAETAALSAPASSHDPAVRDLRELPWASIDNDDSRDLDQLTVMRPGRDGLVTLLVAIADVDALVGRGSAIEAHARANTTSVYTAAQIFPMLPEKLSTNLTSLNPDVERLAIIVEMTISNDGVVRASDVYRARVLNQAKLAYDSVAAWLEGRGPAPAQVAAVPELERQLREQDRLAQALRKLRHQHGALSLESRESRALFQGDALRELKVEHGNRAKELIEDFMIAANGASALFLERHGFPSLRRVLRSPERWGRIVDLARAHGATLPAEADSSALERLLEQKRREDPDTFPELSLAIVKLLGRGEYVVEPAGGKSAGHFGLSVHDYSHSTAPNRRYPDLISQRLIKAALAGKSVPYAAAELDALARHCTEQEDRANKVERQVRKSAAALLLESRIGERFDAIVTGAADKGTWVRISQPTVEGKLVRGGQNLDVGDRLRVELLRTDVERGFIDFGLSERG